jgi:hypothetical protein
VDIALFARVLWRFKYVVSAGFVLAIALSVLTVYKVDLSHGIPGLAPRKTPLYSSTATVLITQPGFPWGSAVQQYESPGPGQASVATGDIGRLTTLANLYVQFVNSDLTKSIVVKRTRGTVTANQNYSFTPSYYSQALPILSITGTNTSPASAIATAQTGVDVLTTYLQRQQQAAKIGDRQRVVLQELARPAKTTVANPVKKTLPVVVFLTIMLMVTGLAFVLENLRPRVPRPVASVPGVDPVVDSAQRSA